MVIVCSAMLGTVGCKQTRGQ